MTPNSMPTTTQTRRMELMDHQINELTNRFNQVEKQLDLLRDLVHTNHATTGEALRAIADYLESDED